ncbi:hypothetical protein IL252_15370 [Halomicrobium sp. IBSBa]|uniref:hypothetical protein n=1 Tax=Halomicrobium sp. IBSBa TaxID=2778916 RepID=UPI001AC00531|nr:hypothetical protein [Halomicrobium sp. IBSBa]MBO4249197.1 hypothetical protein [Halomicrobium sp. IBSBa]
MTDEAGKAREAGQLGRAGNLYTAAAHEHAGTVTEHSGPEPDHTERAVARFVYAATCYRIAGNDFRTQNRCDIGILLAEDYAAYLADRDFEPGTFADLRRGAWPEFIGDLRTIAQRDDADDAYDRAIEIYDSVGDWEFVYGEQEHIRLASYYRDVRRGLGDKIPDDAPEAKGFGTTFAEWVAYKRERLSDLLNALEAQQAWPVPQGQTNE